MFSNHLIQLCRRAQSWHLKSKRKPSSGQFNFKLHPKSVFPYSWHFPLGDGVGERLVSYCSLENKCCSSIFQPILGVDLTFKLCESARPGEDVFTLNLSMADSQKPGKNLAKLGGIIVTGISLYLGRLGKPKRAMHTFILFKP